MPARPRLAVLAAAGLGTRARALTGSASKVLLRVGGVSLLRRNLLLLRDALGIREVLVVVGPQGDEIRGEEGDGAALGMELRYVVNPAVEAGLGSVFAAVRPLVRQPWAMLLADELYAGSNHGELRVPERPFLAVCGVMECGDPARIRQNYGVVVEDGLIRSVHEKPLDPPGPLLGCGTYLFHPDVFRDVDAAAHDAGGGRLEVADVLNHAARRGRVLPFYLTGEYVNVNTPEDWERAGCIVPAELPGAGHGR